MAEIREVENKAQETSIQVALVDGRVGQVQESTAELKTAVTGKLSYILPGQGPWVLTDCHLNLITKDPG